MQKRSHKSKRAQAWSVDLVIGVVIFLLVIGLFYAVLTRNQNQDTTDLKVASETIATKLVTDPSSQIVKDNAVNEDALKTLSQKNMDELKGTFGVKQEFCIFFEDENGNLIPIIIDDSGTQKIYTGVGSSAINVSGTPCSQVSS